MLHTLSALRPYKNEIVRARLMPELRQVWRQVAHSAHWAPLRELLRAETFQSLSLSSLELSSDTITASFPQGARTEALQPLLSRLIPWRIGPFQIGDTLIDSEWRSHLKWNRIAPLLGPLRDKRIADVGASNGYFLFRMASSHPEVGIGFDPVDRCWLQFSVLQSLFKVPRVGFIPTGLASLEAFPNFFDLIVCMGVLYHQRKPVEACRTLFSALRPGGRLVLESLAIDRPGIHVLEPQDRYAKMRNAWNVPSPEALASFAIDAGFISPTIHTFGPISINEQRRTPWAPYESLVDFLDPADISKTIEGHPAPHSAAVVAYKP